MPLPEAGSQLFKCLCCTNEFSLMNVKIFTLKRGRIILCQWCFREFKSSLIKFYPDLKDSIPDFIPE